jgi:integrase
MLTMAMEFTGKFTRAFLDNPADGTHTDGTGLYLFVSNGGKARSWSYRRRGKRKRIGSAFRIMLEQAQERVQEFKAMLKAGKDLMAPVVKGAVWTFEDERKLYVEYKYKNDWKNEKTNKSALKKYVMDTAYAKEPLVNIGVRQLTAIFKPTWNTTPEFARRSAYMIGEMIAIAQNADPPRYPADLKNPVDLTKHGALYKALGKQRPGGHRLGLQPERVAKLVAFLSVSPLTHGPDECTTSEAAEAIGCSTQAIIHAWRRGKLKTRRKLGAPYDHLYATWVWKTAELKEVFPFQKEPPQHAEVDPYAYALLFVIYTAVRPDMACGLLWSEVKWERGYIDFGKRHKMAERDPEAEYTIPITPEVKALLEKQRELQRRDGINTPHVFVHGRKRIGSSYYFGRHLVAHQLNLYLKRVLVLLDLVDGETDPKKMPSAHGFRNTFPEWAGDLSEADKYHLEYIEAQLGHKIKVNNRMYYRNVTYIRHRGDMMTDWEKYCTRLRSAPITPTNIVELKRARSIVGRR